MVQDKLLLGFWLGDARQTNSATFAQIEPDFDQDDLLKRLNDLGPELNFQLLRATFVSDRSKDSSRGRQ